MLVTNSEIDDFKQKDIHWQALVWTNINYRKKDRY